ncbi:transient receptor potential cation channel subfamily A member 1 family [Trichomonas vaginalis G3]|uniref:transient receptor potential cation channel subfamily A member 1 family n=1 Tax=Trichomonas vaginalis (strain ATCC PRA-98 / G3) TaxID=412133 RepID=UPI0021E58036|nr:transient receptor potential cation channel subfamily A member 1 family [Trichomonas vaginalis G3]KAI5546651.1 transient receptor potential cation channel subfamily A member 1 family [Trichomonas vaginalis G3]
MSSIEELKAILDAGGDPNQLIGGMTFLHFCINENDTDTIKYLIDKGCDPYSPNCTSLPPPLHYAIKLKKNKSLLALLKAGVDPNSKTRSGTPALITAVNSGNREAVNLLLEYEANPNVTNKSDEIALFHAINKGDYNSCQVLLDYESQLTVGKRSALHFAIKQNQAECVRILLDHGADRAAPDSNGRTPFEIAADLVDPTIDLLLHCKKLPSSTITQAFVKSIYNNFEEKEIEDLRDVMMASPARIPADIHSFIDRIIHTEHCHIRFLEFLDQREIKLENIIEKLSSPGADQMDHDIYKLSRQLRNSFMKRIEDSTKHQNECQDNIYSPLGLSHYNSWINYTQGMQAFVDKIVEEGVAKFGMKDDCINLLDNSKKEIVKVKEYKIKSNEKTKPFQMEIVDFVSVTIKKLKELQVEGLKDIDKHFKMLLRQIEVTNPELIRSRFKKHKKRQ